ncbi:hypothetical protein LIER_00501 [Lithospermum erythrorhizon]|uniref:Reticulon domain-containing protein n=1 Tax=Lithospermum erythrorhizon TaxID=34254 RepID=A0AAV3NK23_LITER
METSETTNVNNSGRGREVKRERVGKKHNQKALMMLICGSLVYYHCAYRNSSLVSLISDVFIVLLCSLAILGLLFRQMNIQVPVDPLEWQISQDTASSMFACLANTVGAAESVLRVAATGQDKRLFLKVVGSLYVLSVLGRSVSFVTVAYAASCGFCIYMLADNSRLIRLSRRTDSRSLAQETT